MGRRGALAGLLGAGALLRAGLLLTWRPGFVGYYDTSPYVTAARTRVFSDPFRPAGYPALLKALHALSDRVSAVLVLQHLMGVGAALLLYLAVRDLVRVPWLALLAPAVVLLDGFEMLVEHAVLSDSLFVFLVAAGLYAALRARRGGLGWAVAAGALTAAAGVVRTVGLFVLPLVLVALAWPAAAAWKPGFRRVGSAAVAAAALLGAYVHAEAAQTGRAGLSRAPGWSLYARVGQFADCRRFRPPVGTARLCEHRAPARRPGTDYYFWSPRSPAQRAFGAPPQGDRVVGAFARAALLHQPGAYLATLATDFARYVAPDHFRRPRAGQTQTQYIAQARDPHELRFIGGELARYYRDVPRARQSAGALTADYAAVMQVRGPVMLVLLLLAVAAPLLVDGARRPAAVLTAGTTLVLLLVPVATQVYDARYAVAALGPLSAAAALAVDARLGGRRFRVERCEEAH